MKMTYTIEATNNDQGWIDAFNNHMGYDYELGQELSPADVAHLQSEAHVFNNEHAHGNAIQIVGEEIDE